MTGANYKAIGEAAGKRMAATLAAAKPAASTTPRERLIAQATAVNQAVLAKDHAAKWKRIPESFWAVGGNGVGRIEHVLVGWLDEMDGFQGLPRSFPSEKAKNMFFERMECYEPLYKVKFCER